MAVNKGLHPDEISPVTLKSCRYVLTKPLYNLFYVSLKVEIYLKTWKISLNAPIFKNGERIIVQFRLFQNLFHSKITLVHYYLDSVTYIKHTFIILYLGKFFMYNYCNWCLLKINYY